MLRLAIIGCGAVVEDLHLPPLKKLSGRGALAVHALIEPDAARAARIKRHFPAAKVYSTPEAAFAEVAVDLTLITSPPGLHLVHGLAALAAGSHILVEKPMVTTGAAADQLCAAAEAAGRLVAVGLPRRFFPHVTEVAQLIAAGSLGESITFVYREGGPYNWPVASETAFQRANSGGGVLMDKGVHALDTLDQLLGAAVVDKCEDDGLGNGVECNVRLQLAYPACNATGKLQMSWDQPLNNGIWIRGSKGEVALSLDDIGTFRHRAGNSEWRSVRASVTWPDGLALTSSRMAPTGYLACIYCEWVGVLRAILHGETFATTGKSAARVISTIEKAYRVSTPLDLPWKSAQERASLRGWHWRGGS